MLNDPTILARVVDAKRGNFSPALARQILKFAFPPKDIARYLKLSKKAQDGKLTAKERADLEDYLNINDFLIVLKSKAHASLRRESPAA